MNQLAPIALFTYIRLNELKKTIEALKGNYLAEETNLFIFSDGAKHKKDERKIKELRNFLTTVNGFKSVTITNYEKNNGLANSIISGVTEIVNEFKEPKLNRGFSFWNSSFFLGLGNLEKGLD